TGNGPVLFGEGEIKLRSRWLAWREGLPGGKHALWMLDSLGGVLGHRVHLHPEQKYYRISDAMGDKANESLWQKIIDLARAPDPRDRCGVTLNMKPDADRIWTDCDEETLHTVEHFMAICLESHDGVSRHAREVQDCGRIRSRAELELTGKVKITKLDPRGRIACKQKFYTGPKVEDEVLTEREAKLIEDLSDPLGYLDERDVYGRHNLPRPGDGR